MRLKDGEVFNIGSSLADNSKARSLLGWTPSYGGIERLRRGLEETIGWFSDERNLRRYRPGAYSI